MNEGSWYSPAAPYGAPQSAPQGAGAPVPSPVPGQTAGAPQYAVPGYVRPSGPSGAQSAPPPERPAFSGRDKLFAWLTALAGYLFFCAFPMSAKPLGAVIFWAALYAFTFIVQLRGHERFRPLHVAVLFSAALAAAAAVIWSNGFLSFICFSYLLAAYVYLVYAVTGNALEEGMSRLVGADLIRAWFVFPFRSFVRLWPAMFSRGRDTAARRTILKLLLGLLIAVIPTALVLALLSFDSGFTSLLGRIFRIDSDSVTRFILRLAFGIPLAMYFFGLYVSSVTGRCRGVMSAESCMEHAERRRILPAVTAIAALAPLLIVYVIFFISQWGYYTSAFTGVLPKGLSYADYARDGFFQLCAVSAINFVVIACVGIFIKRGHRALCIALSVVFALVTLILVATAMSKLWLYISEYGLSADRVYAAWFMALLSVLFLLVIVGQFSEHFKTLPVCLAVTVVMFLLLALCGSNRMIARYNVDLYLSGRAESIDLEYIDTLGPDAVPELLRLEKELAGRNGFEPPEAGAEFRSWKDSYRPANEVYSHTVFLLRERARELFLDRKYDPWRLTLSSLRAGRLLEEAGLGPNYLPDK